MAPQMIDLSEGTTRGRAIDREFLGPLNPLNMPRLNMGIQTARASPAGNKFGFPAITKASKATAGKISSLTIRRGLSFWAARMGNDKQVRK
jgi:hypothetical protein